MSEVQQRRGSGAISLTRPATPPRMNAPDEPAWSGDSDSLGREAAYLRAAVRDLAEVRGTIQQEVAALARPARRRTLEHRRWQARLEKLLQTVDRALEAE